MSLPLSPTMVELFFAREELKARRILQEQMDSCLDTIFGQMKQKLMQLVENGRGGGETGHGLGELGDSKDHGQKLYGSSNDFSPIPTTSINSDHHLSGSNISKLSKQNVLHQPQRQLHHSSSNPISTSTSTNSIHVPDKNHVATSNQFNNDDNVIIVKNKLVEKVNIIPNNESISTSSSSTQSQPSNDEQSNDSNSIDDDDSFDELDEEEDEEEEDDDDDVQSNEDLDEIENSSPRPTKRPRLAKTNNATDSDIQQNCDESEIEEEEEDDTQLLQRLNLIPQDYENKKERDVLCPECQEIVASKEFISHMWRVHNLRGRPPPRGSYP